MCNGAHKEERARMRATEALSSINSHVSKYKEWEREKERKKENTIVWRTCNIASSLYRFLKNMSN